jgi:hypothetical protein
LIPVIQFGGVWASLSIITVCLAIAHYVETTSETRE